jgi:hypothetical protein
MSFHVTILSARLVAGKSLGGGEGPPWMRKFGIFFHEQKPLCSGLLFLRLP